VRKRSDKCVIVIGGTMAMADKADATRSSDTTQREERKKTYHCQNQLIETQNKDDNLGIISAWIVHEIEFVTKSTKK